MKKIIGFIFAAGFVLCGFIAGSCVNTVEAGQKDFLKFKEVEKTGYYAVTTDSNGQITANLPEGLYKAIEVYTNAVKYNANNYELYYNLGVCYSRINDFDIARKCFQKTIELDEEMYLAYYRLGQLALLYRDFDVAEESFAKSLCNEKEAKAYFELAKIHIIICKIYALYRRLFINKRIINLLLKNKAWYNYVGVIIYNE